MMPKACIQADLEECLCCGDFEECESAGSCLFAENHPELVDDEGPE